MASVPDLEAMREALLAARFAGVRTVEYEGRRVTYASDAEMATALADLERRMAHRRGVGAARQSGSYQFIERNMTHEELHSGRPHDLR